MGNVLTYMDKRSISDWSYKHLITLQSLTEELVWPTMFSVNLVLNEEQYTFGTTLELNFKLAHNYFRLTFYTVFSSIVHSVNTHEATIGIVHLFQNNYLIFTTHPLFSFSRWLLIPSQLIRLSRLVGQSILSPLRFLLSAPNAKNWRRTSS